MPVLIITGDHGRASLTGASAARARPGVVCQWVIEPGADPSYSDPFAPAYALLGVVEPRHATGPASGGLAVVTLADAYAVRQAKRGPLPALNPTKHVFELPPEAALILDVAHSAARLIVRRNTLAYPDGSDRAQASWGWAMRILADMNREAREVDKPGKAKRTTTRAYLDSMRGKS
jgi:hypothetical protein